MNATHPVFSRAIRALCFSSACCHSVTNCASAIELFTRISEEINNKGPDHTVDMKTPWESKYGCLAKLRQFRSRNEFNRPVKNTDRSAPKNNSAGVLPCFLVATTTMTRATRNAIKPVYHGFVQSTACTKRRTGSKRPPPRWLSSPQSCRSDPNSPTTLLAISRISNSQNPKKRTLYKTLNIQLRKLRLGIHHHKEAATGEKRSHPWIGFRESVLAQKHPEPPNPGWAPRPHQPLTLREVKSAAKRIDSTADCKAITPQCDDSSQLCPPGSLTLRNEFSAGRESLPKRTRQPDSAFDVGLSADPVDSRDVTRTLCTGRVHSRCRWAGVWEIRGSRLEGFLFVSLRFVSLLLGQCSCLWTSGDWGSFCCWHFWR